MARFAVTLADEGTIERVSQEFGAMPSKVTKARKRALSKLATWLRRQVLRAVADAAGTSQKTINALLRFRQAKDAHGNSISIWIGTDPIAARHLGTVRWTRKMVGAKVGKRVFPGAWSWPHGKTAGKVMRRTGHQYAASYVGSGQPGSGEFTKRWDAGEGITEVRVPIHDAVKARIDAMQKEISERFERLMVQELRYALEIEGRGKP